MSEKYLSETPASIITNDLYLAAFLHCVGCTLDHVQKNDRRRMSFLFIGERVQQLRDAYRSGPVRLDLRSFRNSLSHIRRLSSIVHEDGAKQRSIAHDPTRTQHSG
jgi:hypothetical protein